MCVCMHACVPIHVRVHKCAWAEQRLQGQTSSRGGLWRVGLRETLGFYFTNFSLAGI